MQRILLAGLVLSTFLAGPLQAQTGIAVRGGTLGPGIEVSHQFWSKVALRAGGTYLSLNGVEATLEDETVDVDFTVDAGLKSAFLLADFFPVGFFHLTGGAVYNAVTVDATGLPAEDYQIQSRTFSRETIGSLSASLEYGRTISPYAGLGFGNIAVGRLIGLTLDAGVIFTGPLSVDLQGTGMLEPTAGQTPVVQEALDGVTIYPLVSLGLVIRP